jgi:hypothetical protein
MFKYIADTCNSAPETGLDDITSFIELFYRDLSNFLIFLVNPVFL